MKEKPLVSPPFTSKELLEFIKLKPLDSVVVVVVVLFFGHVDDETFIKSENFEFKLKRLAVGAVGGRGIIKEPKMSLLDNDDEAVNVVVGNTSKEEPLNRSVGRREVVVLAGKRSSRKIEGQAVVGTDEAFKKSKPLDSTF